MNKLVEKHAVALVERISNASGKTVDTAYSSLLQRLGLMQPYFQEGWGDLTAVDFRGDAELLHHWPPPNFDVKIGWRKVREGEHYGQSFQVLEGSFRTPCQGRVFDALPEQSRTTLVQLLTPKRVNEDTSCVLHLAGTGDHGFARRMRMGQPLLAQGIATMVLESPFYGARRPVGQEGSRLLRVSDLLVLGRATIEESLCLLDWSYQQGYGKLGMSGFSMGGVHASMVASLYPGPVACTPLLAPRSASVAFCSGALWDATAWRPLLSPEDQNHRDVVEIIKEAAQPSASVASAVRALDLIASSGQRPGSPALQQQGSSPQQEDCATRTPASSVATSSGSLDSEMLAEGASVAIHELRNLQEEAKGAVEDCETTQTATKQYGSAAAFLGFRLPGWKHAAGGGNGGAGIGQAEKLLSRLWTDRNSMAAKDAKRRLEQVLETYTDVTRFPCPKQPGAAVFVGAQEDAYVTRESIQELAAHWPGSEVRWVPGGHVSAFLLQQQAFRGAISDSLSRLKV